MMESRERMDARVVSSANRSVIAAAFASSNQNNKHNKKIGEALNAFTL